MSKFVMRQYTGQSASEFKVISEFEMDPVQAAELNRRLLGTDFRVWGKKS